MKKTDLISILRHSRTPLMDGAAKQRIRTALLSAYQELPLPSEIANRRDRPWMSLLRTRPMMIGLIVLAFAIAGVWTASAADAAKPGDTLFPLDQAIESIRLKLAPTDDAKARLATEFAAEREQELTILERHPEKKKDAIQEAQTLADDALSQALTTVDTIREKTDDVAPEHAQQKLNDAEERLQDVQQESRDRFKDAVKGISRIDVTVVGASAKVTIQGGSTDSFTLSTTKLSDMIRQIAQRLGKKESVIRALIRVQREKMKNRNLNTNQYSDENENRTTNTNRSINLDINARVGGAINAVKNLDINGRLRNLNASIDKHGDSDTKVRIEIHSINGQTKIKTVVGAEMKEWTVDSTDKTEIIASVVAHTGLSSATVSTYVNAEAN